MLFLFFLIFFVFIVKEFFTSRKFKGIVDLLRVVFIMADIDKNLALRVITDKLLISDFQNEVDQVICLVHHMLWNLVADHASA